MATRIVLAEQQILDFLQQQATAGRRVYSARDIANIFRENKERWRLRKDYSFTEFTEFLEKRKYINKNVFPHQSGKSITKYTFGNPTKLEKILSLFKGCYLSHASAVYIHRLNEQIPKNIYINHEQSPKDAKPYVISQEELDANFHKPQRPSQQVIVVDDTEVIVLNGKYTNNLEVSEFESPEGEFVRCTRLERTLIDIVVRPSYSGGVFQIAKAYEAAEHRMSVNVMVATLKKLNYFYPYHQAIGFLMDKAGYDEARTKRLYALGINHKFYLMHATSGKQYYDEKWQLFYPQGL